MIDHVSFIERLSELEREAAVREWHETRAGLLVLRLCDQRDVSSGRGRRDAASAEAVRALVDCLPDATDVKGCLTRILEVLPAGRRGGTEALRTQLCGYGRALAASGRAPMALDVRRSARRRESHRRARGAI